MWESQDETKSLYMKMYFSNAFRKALIKNIIWLKWDSQGEPFYPFAFIARIGRKRFYLNVKFEDALLPANHRLQVFALLAMGCLRPLCVNEDYTVRKMVYGMKRKLGCLLLSHRPSPSLKWLISFYTATCELMITKVSICLNFFKFSKFDFRRSESWVTIKLRGFGALSNNAHSLSTVDTTVEKTKLFLLWIFGTLHWRCFIRPIKYNQAKRLHHKRRALDFVIAREYSFPS